MDYLLPWLIFETRRSSPSHLIRFDEHDATAPCYQLVYRVLLNEVQAVCVMALP